MRILLKPYAHDIFASAVDRLIATVERIVARPNSAETHEGLERVINARSENGTTSVSQEESRRRSA
jgi:hypothetical protein